MAIGRADIPGIGEMRIDEVVEVGDHLWSYNGGEFEGLFTDLEWVVASVDAITAYLQLEGFDPLTIDEILAEEIIIDAIASNDTGDKVIGVQWTTYIPEPVSLALLGLGGLVVLRRRRS